MTQKDLSNCTHMCCALDGKCCGCCKSRLQMHMCRYGRALTISEMKVKMKLVAIEAENTKERK